MKGTNPQVLRWARESAGLSIEEVACHFKKDAEFIESWEAGSSSPSFPQLEKLAKKYKRPTALFFFPEIPQEETIKGSFRSFPEQNVKSIKPHLRFLIRKAKAMQINLSELTNGHNPAARLLVDKLNVEHKSVDVAAKDLRDYLGVDLRTQQQYGTMETAFKKWRSVIHNNGVFVFKDAFKDKRFSGFCLYDDIFPVIYINNSLPYSRQIFTLFHELAHVLFKTNHIETLSMDREPPYLVAEKYEKIEILCNAFAGKFLVPDDDFVQYLNVSVDDGEIERLARKYIVSREVVLRKFKDEKIINANFYEAKVTKWKAEWNAKKQTAKNQKGGGNSNFTKRAYLGESYMDLAFRQYYKNNISVEQLADYLDVGIGRISKMESLIFEKRSQS